MIEGSDISYGIKMRWFWFSLLFSFAIGVGWVRAQSLEVEGELLRFAPIPKAQDVAPYRRALCSFVYRVRKVHQGDFQDDEIMVVKWCVWQGGELKGLPEKIGGVERLTLSLWSAHPEFAREMVVSLKGDLEKVVYYDPQSHPEKGRIVSWEEVQTDSSAEMKRGVVEGERDGWLFLADEIAHAQEGEFWKKEGGGLASIKAMLDFQKRLRAVGVELLVVPVPTKLSCYPVSLRPGLPIVSQSGFVELCRAEGLEVIDLEPVFRGKVDQQGVAMYCAQDTHWTPEASRVCAGQVVEWVKKRSWYEGRDLEKNGFELGGLEFLEIEGDLVNMLGEKRPGESLMVQKVMKGDRVGMSFENATSPYVILGDSHVSVFSSSDEGMHCRGAGLPDYFAAELGVAADVIVSPGSGGHGARLNLYQQRVRNPKYANYWKGKKLVVWCFSVREFTQSAQWSSSIPVEVLGK